LKRPKPTIEAEDASVNSANERIMMGGDAVDANTRSRAFVGVNASAP